MNLKGKLVQEARYTTPIYFARYSARPVAKDAIFVLDDDYVVEVRVGAVWERITVPEGFATDLASIPPIFRWIISKLTGIEASVVHDWLYCEWQFRGYCPMAYRKRFADDVFLALLVAAGEPRWRRLTMYWAVRLFGARAYYT